MKKIEACSHGATLHGKLNGNWRGETRTCKCCNSQFGVSIDGAAWEPAGLCALCGGAYVRAAPRVAVASDLGVAE